MLVEGCRLVILCVLCVDHQGIRGNLGTGGALERIGRQRTAEAVMIN
jgi:hypothetical protein